MAKGLKAGAMAGAVALLFLAACGVEGPPVPPQNAAATMQRDGALPAMTGAAMTETATAGAAQVMNTPQAGL